MAVIQVLLDNHPGPLPIKGQFQPQADLVPALYFTGTAQAASPATSLEVQVAIYDQGTQYNASTDAIIFSNEAKQHKTLITLPLPQKPFTFGVTYTYEISPTQASTVTDANDSFSLTILY